MIEVKILLGLGGVSYINSGGVITRKPAQWHIPSIITTALANALKLSSTCRTFKQPREIFSVLNGLDPTSPRCNLLSPSTWLVLLRDEPKYKHNQCQNFRPKSKTKTARAPLKPWATTTGSKALCLLASKSQDYELQYTRVLLAAVIILPQLMPRLNGRLGKHSGFECLRPALRDAADR